MCLSVLWYAQNRTHGKRGFLPCAVSRSGSYYNLIPIRTCTIQFSCMPPIKFVILYMSSLCLWYMWIPSRSLTVIYKGFWIFFPLACEKLFMYHHLGSWGWVHRSTAQHSDFRAHVPCAGRGLFTLLSYTWNKEKSKQNNQLKIILRTKSKE